MSDYTLHLGDCLDVMATLDAGSVDAVVTDPPYGIGESGAKNVTRSNAAVVKDCGDYSWDSERLSMIHIAMMRGVSQNQVIFGGNFYADMLPPSPAWIVWDKVNSGDFADCELAWTSHKRAVRQYTYMWNGMIKQMPEERYHPTQKPLSLMIWVLENYTQPGDTVLDPFMGSGTTGVACIKTGRRFIGVEISEEYFKVAEKRIREAAAQPSLFEMGQLA